MFGVRNFKRRIVFSNADSTEDFIPGTIKIHKTRGKNNTGKRLLFLNFMTISLGRFVEKEKKEYFLISRLNNFVQSKLKMENNVIHIPPKYSSIFFIKGIC